MDNAKGSNARTIGRMTEAVAQELRALLARKKYSAARLSKESGIPRATLHRTLNAQRAIDVEDLVAICDFFGEEASEIVARAEHTAFAYLMKTRKPSDAPYIVDEVGAGIDEVGAGIEEAGATVHQLDARRVRDDERAVASPLSDDHGEDGGYDA